METKGSNTGTIKDKPIADKIQIATIGLTALKESKSKTSRVIQRK